MGRQIAASLFLMLFVPIQSVAASASNDSNTAAGTPDKASAAPATLASEAVFNGIWEGTFRMDPAIIEGKEEQPNAGGDIRIEIRDLVVRVYSNIQNHSDFTEIMPGSFHIAPVMTNAVIYGTHFSGIWTETWTFTITQESHDMLLVSYARVVNNNGAAGTAEGKKFTFRGVGEFKRLPVP